MKFECIIKVLISSLHVEQSGIMNVWHYSLPLTVVYVVFIVETTAVRQSGNFTVAAYLPVHISAGTNPRNCSTQLDFKRVVQIQAIMYATEKVNSDPNLLERVSLGYDIKDTCGEDPQSVFTNVKTLFNKPYKSKAPVALLLDFPQLLAHLAAVSIPQNVPLFSFNSIPNVREGNIFYLEPGQRRLPSALRKLVQEFNWTLVDVFVENEEDYELFEDSIKSSKICVNNVFHRKKTISQILSVPEAKEPLLVFSDGFELFKQLPSSFFREREILFASDFLDTDKNRSNIEFPGMIAVQRKRPQIKEFQEYLWETAQRNKTWLGKLLRNASQFEGCGGTRIDFCPSVKKRLFSELRYAGKAIDAVYAVAHGLNNTKSDPLSSEDISAIPEFTSLTGNPIRFTASRDLWEVDYEVYKLEKMESIFVGNLKTFPKMSDLVLALDLDKIEWNSVNRGQPNSTCLASCPEGVAPVPSAGRLSKCCVTCPEQNSTVCEEGRRLSKDGMQCVVVRMDYLRWKHPFSLIMMILVVIVFCLLLYLVNLYVKKAQTPTILQSKLATLPLLISLFITLIVPLLPILKPSTSACNAYTFGYIQGLGIPLCILISRSCSYYKRFRTEEGRLKKKLCWSDPQNVIAVVLILIQLVLSVIFLAVLPAKVVHYKTDDSYVDYIECSLFSSGEFLYPFFYTILLTIIFSVKNFAAVTREEDVYESNFAALSIFGFYFLSLLTLVVLYAIHGKVKIMFVCLIAFLYAIDFLVFVFFPKIYVIVFKRDPSAFSPFPLSTGGFEGELLISEKSSKEDLPSS